MLKVGPEQIETAAIETLGCEKRKKTAISSEGKKSSTDSFRMSGPVFLALVNPKSGGNMGTQLLNRFSEILNEDRIYNLSEEGGPKRALQEHKGTENLRIIGKVRFPGFAIDISSEL